MKRRTIPFVAALVFAVAAAPQAWSQNPLPATIPPLPTGAGGSPSTRPAPGSIDEIVQGGSRSEEDAETLAKQEAARSAVWNSPEMQAAIVWLRQYFTRAKAVSPQQAQDYFTQLQRLPADQMKSWLQRFQRDRQLDAQRQAVVDRARQIGVDAALRAQRQSADRYSNINRGAALASRTTAETLQSQRQFSSLMALQNAQNRDATIVANTPGAAFQTGPYYLAFPPYAPYYAAATNPFPDGVNVADPRELRDAADIERSTRER